MESDLLSSSVEDEEPRGLTAPAHERFRIERELGRGGMGVVYEAHDHERQGLVALKTLRRMAPAALYRFKNEFRALTDVSHPNLVSLYELVSHHGQWFFTMELVRGQRFLSWVHALAEDSWAPEDEEESTQAPPGDARGATVIDAVPDAVLADPSTGVETRPHAGRLHPPRPPAFFSRLRDGLRQLAEGITALHDSGHLHRDIKPSNVMVTDTGRVVLLDFGLVTETGRPMWQHDTGDLAGTAAYMAPEQARREATPASDWYGVGVILYEALTGRRPFVGDPQAILQAKQTYEAVPPRFYRDDIPDDLAELCADLLRADPRARPVGADVLARLGGAHRPSGPLTVDARAPQPPAGLTVLLGRERHLQRLRGAFARTQEGTSSILYVHGTPGSGKTALVQQFLEELSFREGAVVLSGRCYERESVPYKAVDSLVDALSRYLRSLHRHEADALLPRDVMTLARAFPVLRRVEAVASARRRRLEAADPRELRRRAFGALRELFGRIAAQRPLVLFIDDLQWGDADSAALIDAITRPPDPPPMLLIGCYRSEDAGHAPLVKALLRPGSTFGGERPALIEVGPLSHEDATTLASQLLKDAGLPLALAPGVADESAGNPLLLHELVHFASGHASAGSPSVATLDDVVRMRMDALSSVERGLIEVVAVAGYPIALRVATAAARLTGHDLSSVHARVRAARMLRFSGLRGDDLVECYHDRVREAVVGMLSHGERADHHGRLARALESTEHPDPETLALHFRAAGEREAAAEYAALAAAQALGALAFERAADLFRQALELSQHDRERHGLRISLADALASAGRGADAAPVYLQAAEHVEGAEALELRRRAAMQYLKSGHTSTGKQVIEDVAAAVGLDLARIAGARPRPPWHTRVRLAVLGLRYRPRDTSEISAADKARIDVCWSLALGFSGVEPVRASALQARQLVLALGSGDEPRIARAMALELGLTALRGSRAGAAVERLRTRASELATRLDDPYTSAFLLLATGATELLCGRWRSALALADAAEQAFREQCRGAWWEIATAQAISLQALLRIGSIAELARRVPPLLKEADERGDLYALGNLAPIAGPVLAMARDDVVEASRRLRRAVARLPRDELHLQHVSAAIARVMVLLYSGKAWSALELVEREWPSLEARGHHRIELVRVTLTHVRALCHLACAAAHTDEARNLAAARRCVRRLSRERAPWARALAGLREGSLAHLSGDRAGAIAALEVAETALTACDMELLTLVARLRRAELADDREVREQAMLALERAGIAAPRKAAHTLVP